MISPFTAAKPSSAYLYTLSAACIGLPFLGLGLGGALIARAGGDPMRALDVDGMVMFLLAFAILFATRLLFWPPAPPALRATVRAVVSAIFAVGIVAALASVVLSLQLPPATPHASFPVYCSILALLFQPAAILWLARYRQAGL